MSMELVRTFCLKKKKKQNPNSNWLTKNGNVLTHIQEKSHSEQLQVEVD